MANKRLYTESDVAALPRGAALVLGKDALATPAALDLAFTRGVRISWGEAPSGDAKPSDDALKRMLAQEGTYVVTVQKGGAVIARLEGGVPTPFGSVSAGAR